MEQYNDRAMDLKKKTITGIMLLTIRNNYTKNIDSNDDIVITISNKSYGHQIHIQQTIPPTTITTTRLLIQRKR